MPQTSDRPFASIESTQEFVSLLLESVDEAQRDVNADIAQKNVTDTRHLEALRVAALQLHNLRRHVVRTKRILNDLRTIRRLLFHERFKEMPPPPVETQSAATPGHLPASTTRAIRAMAKAAAAK